MTVRRQVREHLRAERLDHGHVDPGRLRRICLAHLTPAVDVLGPHAEDDLATGLRAELAMQRVGQLQLEAAGLDPQFPATVLGSQLAREEIHGRAADKASHEQVGRPIIERLGCIQLLQEPVAQNGDAVTHRHRFGLVVGDVHGRGQQPLVELDQAGASLDA